MDYLVLFLILAFVYFIAFQKKEQFVDETMDTLKKTQNYVGNIFRSTFNM
jgi:hypothetical protein